MKDHHRDCIEEIQELMIQINEVIEKYGLKEEVIVAMAVGFLNLDEKSILPNEEGITVSMNLLSSISVEDEDELDDLLSYVLDAYRIEQENNPSNINYWINRMGGGELN
jgi:hypothetical protein